MTERMLLVTRFYSWPVRTWELGRNTGPTLEEWKELIRKLGRES